MRAAAVMVGAGLICVVCRMPAQQPALQPMGTVPTHDALVAGGLEVQGERARLLTNASVTAYNRTATIALSRGGEVMVCATSQFHLLRSGGGKALLFGLDRGAVEIHSASDAQDVVLTPDIRFTTETQGPMDLKIRVTREGDTCVDNAGPTAPVLMLSDAFSSVSYRVMPRQHVMFEHGSLHEVVDHESSNCGCPMEEMLLAAKTRAGEHPFPEAQSQGLAPVSVPDNTAPAGEKHTQVTTTFSYGEGQGPPPSTLPAPAVAAGAGSPAVAPGGSGSGTAEPPPSPPGAHEVGRAIGRFFRRLFGRKPQS